MAGYEGADLARNMMGMKVWFWFYRGWAPHRAHFLLLPKPNPLPGAKNLLRKKSSSPFPLPSPPRQYSHRINRGLQLRTDLQTHGTGI